MACFSYLFELLEVDLPPSIYRSSTFTPAVSAPLPEKPLLIPRFQHSPVLHNHAHPPRKVQHLQQVLHRRRKYLCSPHFPAKFDKIIPFTAVIHDVLIPEEQVGYTMPPSYSSNFSQSRSRKQSGCGKPFSFSALL
jgi:hypothetical protein